MNVDVIAIVGQALADPTRVRVLGLCDGKLAVGEIAIRLGVTSATVSHHIAVLVRGGLVEVVRRGRRHLPTRVPGALGLLGKALG